MANAPYLNVNRRHDFVLLFDVTDGNPNGDPDAGNLPRVDPETMQGLVTDVALKRKVRDWVDVVGSDQARFKIYVQRESYLTEARARVFANRAEDRKDVQPSEARQWMCEEFYDIRLFGAVMTTGVNCGQVRGPIQITFARSLDPVVPLDLSITRVAVTREEDAAVVVSDKSGTGTGGKQTEMGRKALVPYGLYRGHGFFIPHFAQQTGVNEDDLDIFWQALQNMWDLDRSSSRGLMACQGLYVFTHDSPLGNAPAHALFERVRVTRQGDQVAPRSFGDYMVDVDTRDLPPGVQLTVLVG